MREERIQRRLRDGTIVDIPLPPKGRRLALLRPAVVISALAICCALAGWALWWLTRGPGQ